jgi:photosystem II stability/assembly factor-like uncharacterized protein
VPRTLRAILPAALLLFATPSAAQWVRQAADTATEYRALHAVSQRQVWAVGRGGAWAHTRDGRRWDTGRIPGAEGLFLTGVHGIGAWDAVVLGTSFDGGLARIWRTDNGGRTWRQVFEDARPGAFWDGMAFLDSRRAVAFGDPVGGVLAVATTRDGGRTWALVPGSRLPRLLEGEAGFAASGTAITAAAGRVYIGTGGGRVARVIRSADGGRTWAVAETPLPASASAGIFGLAFRDARRGVAVGGDYQRPEAGGANVAVTRDGGITWTRPADPGLEGVMYGVTHVEGGSYVAAGPTGSFLTRDDGATWRRIGREGFNAVAFSGRTGWAAGTGGRIAAWTVPESGDPALVALLVVDQLRPDYLERYAGQWTGGFARLMSEGTVYLGGRQDHALTATAPGHSTMLSGRFPANTGIVSNDLGVNSNDWPLVGTGGPGASPARFRGTTLYDWLRADDARSRVLSVSPKDRGAILPVGRAGGTVLWYSGGRFTTSRWYADSLPAWVREFNARPGLQAHRGRRWELLLPSSAYAEPDSQPWERGGRDNVFPHLVPRDSAGWASRGHRYPWMDSLALSLALEGVRRTGLGRGGRTDLLSVSLSTTDRIGHDYGPDSREIHDHLLRLDRWLGTFLDSLAALAPSGVVLALTADHGVLPYPEQLAAEGADVGRAKVSGWVAGIRDSLRARWGTGFGLRFDNGILLADLGALRARGVDTTAFSAAMAAGLRRTPGIAAAWSPRELSTRPAADETAALWRRNLPADLSWAAVAVLRDGWLWGEAPTTTDHETTALANRSVPIIFWGPGVAARRCAETVRTVDIAPTLAALLGITPTEALDGRALPLTRCTAPSP